MASQTDKKEEFRKYLEKSNVLAILTNILTDLFEMDSKPEDPGQYMYQKFGESLQKSSATQPDSGTVQIHHAPNDTLMTEALNAKDAAENDPQSHEMKAVSHDSGGAKPEVASVSPMSHPKGTEAPKPVDNQSAAAKTSVRAEVPPPSSNLAPTAEAKPSDGTANVSGGDPIHPQPFNPEAEIATPENDGKLASNSGAPTISEPVGEGAAGADSGTAPLATTAPVQ